LLSSTAGNACECEFSELFGKVYFFQPEGNFLELGLMTDLVWVLFKFRKLPSKKNSKRLHRWEYISGQTWGDYITNVIGCDYLSNARLRLAYEWTKSQCNRNRLQWKYSRLQLFGIILRKKAKPIFLVCKYIFWQHAMWMNAVMKITNL